MHTYLNPLIQTYAHTHIHTHTHIYTHTPTYVHKPTHLHIHTPTSSNTPAPTQIHTYIYIYIYTHTHTSVNVVPLLHCLYSHVHAQTAVLAAQSFAHDSYPLLAGRSVLPSLHPGLPYGSPADTGCRGWMRTSHRLPLLDVGSSPAPVQCDGI